MVTGAAMLVFAAGLPVMAAPVCNPQVIDSVPLATANHHYIVHARINGTDVPMILDTGAQLTTVTAALVDRLNLPYDRRHMSVMVTAGGRGNPNYDVILSNLTVGKLSVSDVRAMIDGEDLTTPDFAGILGADVLFGSDVEIDFPNRMITFYRPSACHGRPADWGAHYITNEVQHSEKSGRILLRAVLNGHPLTALLDTGAVNTVVARRAVEATGIVPANDNAGFSLDANGIRTPVHTARFDTVQIGSELFRNVPMPVSNNGFGEADMLVGLDYLQRRVIWLPADGGRIFIERPGEAVPALRLQETER
jgi:clan AA aspartic protease (TIGR02281 family)